MASKRTKTNGHDSATVEMVDLLRQVVRGIGALREDMHEQFGELREEVAGLRADLKSYQKQADAQITDLAHEGAEAAPWSSSASA